MGNYGACSIVTYKGVGLYLDILLATASTTSVGRADSSGVESFKEFYLHYMTRWFAASKRHL